MTQVFVSAHDVNTADVKWIDARFSLQDEKSGKLAYQQEHLKGAVHWDLEEDLSGASRTGGRHPLPSKEQLTELFRTSGLELTDAILIYDDGGSPFATRAWWMLQYAGFTDVHVVTEGYRELRGMFDVTAEPAVPAKSAVEPNWQEQLYADRHEVEEVAAGNRLSVLVDARSEVRYRGEKEPLYHKAGHIPTARNFDWEQLKQGGQFDVEKVKEQLMQTAAPEDDIIVYCGSGVTASPLFAALTELDYPNVKLYVGSFSDWISQDDAPIETAIRG
ncbi:sulfurtransferase [Sporosarcina sp. P33]|uniref:sulfurtransferase n=1 Tax=Sporosarcina sp. P33 TaxID=1930764 RepID=UPI0009BD053C|nr:sulfurtransferase [Sporosarcina sp. P33]ARD49498.1 thiosulfate sulfurtransferase [Sporosarcina sp. P33]